MSRETQPRDATSGDRLFYVWEETKAKGQAKPNALPFGWVQARNETEAIQLVKKTWPRKRGLRLGSDPAEAFRDE